MNTYSFGAEVVPHELADDFVDVFGGPKSGETRRRNAGDFSAMEWKNIGGRMHARAVRYTYDPQCVAYVVLNKSAWKRDDPQRPLVR